MIDPKSAMHTTHADFRDNPLRAKKKAHPWAWIVGLVAATLLVWGFFGMDHLKADVEPTTVPAATTSVAE